MFGLQLSSEGHSKYGVAEVRTCLQHLEGTSAHDIRCCVKIKNRVVLVVADAAAVMSGGSVVAQEALITYYIRVILGIY